MFGFITRHILTGLITIVPVLLTVYLIYWFIVSTEAVLGDLIRFVIPDAPYWPGLGVIAGLAIVFCIGLLMHVYVVQRLFEKAEQLLYHTPLIKSIYGALRDFFHYFSVSKKKDFRQVVSVRFSDNLELIGFITQSNSERMPAGMDTEGKVLVYMPMSYMIGGYAVLVPRSAVTNLDMSMEEAMRFTLTAGVASNGNNSPH
ncbi:DUF502 domain-containing protein [Methylophaga sp. OBS4]|uniref:DUF502 domain-containing protein n=1 Tax=Methylophaga sp. OBS4 TaxID=2991935 RepID=UPI00224F2BF5|nr:DUF502 domain-containing protein [Methylophaga sp. OBS4]MCX4188236.1 DUF502 domain-containing protein [Methylophaga sp. OBS4]